MYLNRPAQPLTFEQGIALEAGRLKARRQKSAERRKTAHARFWDDQTVEALGAKGPSVCGVDGCGRSHKARGLCGAHYKAARRRSGKTN